MFTKVLIAIVFSIVSVTAQSTETSRFSCSLWTQAVSRALFNNTGTFATKGPAIFAVPECIDTKSGMYGNLFLIIPTKDFDTGKEIDVRIGRRFKAGQYDVDASAAFYYFGVDGDMYRTGNARMRVSRTFDVSNITIVPYGMMDYQRSLTFHTNSLGLAAGAVVEKKLTSLPGTPTLALDVSGWKYATTASPNKGPIWPLDVSITFPVTQKVTVGGRIMQTWGNVVDSSFKPKHMAGIFAYTSF